MGLRMYTVDGDDGPGAFSQNILKIKISGPDVSALAVYVYPSDPTQYVYLG